jgi:hypothetical protein
MDVSETLLYSVQRLNFARDDAQEEETVRLNSHIGDNPQGAKRDPGPTGLDL